MRPYRYLGIACCILFFPPADSQLVRTAGVKIGAVSATQVWEYSNGFSDIGAEALWGFDAGGYVEWLNHPLLSISTEFHYIEKGFQTQVAVTSETSPDGTGQFIVYEARVTYFSFPILAKIRADLEGVTLYGVAGPRIDLLLEQTSGVFSPVLDNLSKSELGATFGIGLEVPLHPALTLGAEVSYSPGLQAVYSSDLLKVYNQSIQLVLVIGF
jgi:opacity protein-like surface antigen